MSSNTYKQERWSLADLFDSLDSPEVEQSRQELETILSGFELPVQPGLPVVRRLQGGPQPGIGFRLAVLECRQLARRHLPELREQRSQPGKTVHSRTAQHPAFILQSIEFRLDPDDHFVKGAGFLIHVVATFRCHSFQYKEKRPRSK